MLVFDSVITVNASSPGKKKKKKMRVVRRLCLDAKSGRCVLFVFREELSGEKAAG